MELHAAIHGKLHEGAITRAQARIILDQLDLDERERLWSWLPLTERIMADVASTFRSLPESVFLRTGDAVHLVTARTHAFEEIWSGDARLIAAAPHLGLVGRTLPAGTTTPVRRPRRRSSP